MEVGRTGITVSSHTSGKPGRPKKKYLWDGKYVSEKEGMALIRKNMRTKADSYPDYLRRAKQMGQLNGYISMWHQSHF